METICFVNGGNGVYRTAIVDINDRRRWWEGGRLGQVELIGKLGLLKGFGLV